MKKSDLKVCVVDNVLKYCIVLSKEHDRYKVLVFSQYGNVAIREVNIIYDAEDVKFARINMQDNIKNEIIKLKNTLKPVRSMGLS